MFEPSRSERSGPGLFGLVLPAICVVACMAAALGLASWPSVASAMSRPALITALAALGLMAVGLSLWRSMGLRDEPLAVRLLILVPLFFSVALTVILMLDTHGRGPGNIGGAGNG